jgi:hypothetical protein
MKAQEDLNILDFTTSGEHFFYIPVYQRNYSWKKEQCQLLWDDLCKVLDGREEKHFFGTVFFFTERSGLAGKVTIYDLIDGQQRLTTVLLLLLALRDTMPDQGEVKRADLDEGYIFNKNRDDANKIKLKQAGRDMETYEKIAAGDLSHIDNKSSIYANYLFFKQQMKGLLQKHTPLQVLEAINRFYIIAVEVEPAKPYENPQVIFESMNSNGLELTVNDLVRNYLLMGLGHQEQEDLYSRYWVGIEDNLDRDDKWTTVFVRQFLHLKSARVVAQNDKDVYRAYVAYAAGTGQSKHDLIVELYTYSTYFAQIIGAKRHPNPQVEQLLQEISKEIKVNLVICVLLRLLELNQNGESDPDPANLRPGRGGRGQQGQDAHLDDDRLLALLEALITYLVRCNVVRTTSAGSRDELYMRLSQQIGRIAQTKDPAAALFKWFAGFGYARRLPNDEEVREALKNEPFYSLNLKRYILAKIANHMSKDGSINPLEHKFNYEHIMPQSLTAATTEAKGYLSRADYEHAYEKCLHSFANATLVSPGFNSELGNESFAAKKKALAQNSNYLISRQWITDKKRWDRPAMEARFKSLFREFTATFPLPEPMRYQDNWSGQGGDED